MFGHLTNDTFAATLIGDRAVFNALNEPAPFAGKFTMMVPGEPGDPSVPAGHGFGTVRVNAAGRARFAGILADGTRVSQSAALSKDGMWPLYASLYSGRGQIWSWITFSNQAESDLKGGLSWIKCPNAKALYYPNGFTNEYQSIGSAYLAPLGRTILNFSEGKLEFIGGDLASCITNHLSLGLKSKVDTGDKRFTMSFTLPNGTYKGRVDDPANGESRQFRGAVLQKLNAGYGFLLGDSQSSGVVFCP
jgi:hypothetical protein